MGKNIVKVRRKGTSVYSMAPFETLKAGDTVFRNGISIDVAEDAHHSGDAAYDGYLIYDKEQNGWFPEDLDRGAIECRSVELHVCPNGCTTAFATVAHIAQDWKVDAFGNFLDVISDGETVASPDDGNVWECLECGAEAEKVSCYPAKISGAGTAYIPCTPAGCVYFITEGSGEVGRSAIYERDGVELTKLDGKEYRMDALRCLAGIL